MQDETRDFHWRLQMGDAEAFRDLVRRHHGRLLGVARAFTGNAATAEEVVQETWLAVIKGISGLKDPDALISWLYAILANTARRRAKRDRRIVLFAGTDEEGGNGGGAYPPVDSFTPRGFWRVNIAQWDDLDPERIVAGREIWAHIRAAIDDLPDGQRAVVLMHDVEGVPPQDICRILDISENNRRVLLHRARTRLRCVLDGLLT